MAHFAEIDLNNKVVRVIVVHNNELLDENGQENEQKGVVFCQNLFGGKWIQTSYNGNIRKNYAGYGYSYDAERDAFISPKPFSSWILDEETCRWQAPVPKPSNDISYFWNEETLSWVEVENLE